MISVVIYVVIVAVGITTIRWRGTDPALQLRAARPLARGHLLSETDLVAPPGKSWAGLLLPGPVRLSGYYLRCDIGRDEPIVPNQLSPHEEIKVDAAGWLLVLTVTGWLAENLTAGDRVMLVATDPAAAAKDSGPAADAGQAAAAMKQPKASTAGDTSGAAGTSTLATEAARAIGATSVPAAGEKKPLAAEAAPSAGTKNPAMIASTPGTSRTRERVVADDLLVRGIRREPAARAGTAPTLKAVVQVARGDIDIPEGVTVRLKHKYGGE